MVTGEAAETAAALCVQRGVAPRRLDRAALPERPLRQGVIV